MPPKINETTVLAVELNRNRIKMWELSSVMRCSDRELNNYMRRIRPVKRIRVGPLCDFLDMDPDELLDEKGYLRAAGG